MLWSFEQPKANISQHYPNNVGWRCANMLCSFARSLIIWILVFSFLVFTARALGAWAIKRRKKTRSITCRRDRANEANKGHKTDATSHNVVACCWGFLANNVASVCMGLNVWPVSNYTQQVPTSANIVVVPCKRTRHVGPNSVACCWPTMLRPFALALRGM